MSAGRGFEQGVVEGSAWPCATEDEVLEWWQQLPLRTSDGEDSSKTSAWRAFTPAQRAAIRDRFGLEAFGPVATIR